METAEKATSHAQEVVCGWRDAHPEATLTKEVLEQLFTTLEGQDFTGVDFSGAKIDKAEFDGSTFTEVELTGATFTDCTFGDTLFSHIESSDTAFEDCIFPRSTFSHVKIDNITMRSAFPREATLKGASLSDVTFNKGHLTNLFIEKATFSDVRFIRVQSKNVEFKAITSTDRFEWDGSVLIKTSFHDSSISYGVFDWASFHDCNISGSMFLRGYFYGATFANTLLSHLEFDRCFFEHVNTYETRFKSVTFNRANFYSPSMMVSDICDSAFTHSALKEGDFLNVDFRFVDMGTATLERTEFRRCSVAKSTLPNDDVLHAIASGDGNECEDNKVQEADSSQPKEAMPSA